VKQSKPKPRRKRKQKVFRFELTTPNAGSILDAAEDALIAKAIAKATGGTR
jgi:hypothetical protein